MIRVSLERPWLVAAFESPMRMLSWAPHNPGFVDSGRVVWREVRDADLTEDFDALAWLSGELHRRGEAQAVGLLTSRDLSRYRLEHAVSGLTLSSCLATVGLSNAERVGHRQGSPVAAFGTINVLAATETALCDTALVELLSIATQARTAAVMEHGPDLPTGRATGTGTDCIVVAAPPGDGVFTGLHTQVGEAVGATVYRAVSAGVTEWMDEMAR